MLRPPFSLQLKIVSAAVEVFHHDVNFYVETNYQRYHLKPQLVIRDNEEMYDCNLDKIQNSEHPTLLE